MKQQIRRGCIGVLLSVLFGLALIEGGLRVLDPFGAIRYYTDLNHQFAGFVQDDNRGYAMYPGLYEFSNWTALIERDGNRRTPDTHADDCTIAFVGDSLTWGFGVNDADTFPNLLAQQIPAQVINTGLSGYNSENVLMTIGSTPADGYIYTIIDNDDDATVAHDNPYPIPPVSLLADHMAAAIYLDYAFKSGGGTAKDSVRFGHDMTMLAARDDVLLTVFEDARGWHRQVVGLAPDVLLIPPYTHMNSKADPHPNAEGHQQIAAALLDNIKAFVTDVCKP